MTVPEWRLIHLAINPLRRSEHRLLRCISRQPRETFCVQIDRSYACVAEYGVDYCVFPARFSCTNCRSLSHSGGCGRMSRQALKSALFAPFLLLLQVVILHNCQRFIGGENVFLIGKVLWSNCMKTPVQSCDLNDNQQR